VEASQRVRAQARLQGTLRCALCHGDVEEAHEPCVGCRTLVHPECRQTNGGCPTLGCSFQTQRPARRRAPTRGRRQPIDVRAVLRVVCGVGSGILVAAGLIGMLISLIFLGMYRSNDVVAGAAGFVGSALLVASGTVSLTLLTVLPFRGEPPPPPQRPQ